MRFQTDKKSLADAVQKAQSLITSDVAAPILRHLLFAAEGEGLTIRACDGEIIVELRLRAFVDAPGKIAMDAKLLNALLKKLPDKKIAFDVAENGLVQIDCETTKYKMLGMESQDFPDVEYCQEERFTIESTVLADALKLVHYAAATDASRPVLESVFMHGDADGKLSFASTDGRRMAIVQQPISGTDEGFAKFSVILPIKAARELVRHAGKDGMITVSVSEGKVMFSGEHWSFISCELNGQYPDYRHIVNGVQPKHALKVERKPLLDALERVAIPSQNVNVKVNLASNALSLFGMIDGIGEASETVLIPYAGPEITMFLNAGLLIDALKVSGDEVTLNITDAETAILITGDAGFRYILMPTRGNVSDNRQEQESEDDAEE